MKNNKIKIGFVILAAPTIQVLESGNSDGAMIDCTNTARSMIRELEGKGCEIVKYAQEDSKNMIMDIPNAIKSSEKFCAEDVDCVIYFVGSYIHAASYLQSARLLKRPIAVWVPIENALASGLTLKGSFSEVGTIDFELFYEGLDNTLVKENMFAFIKASYAKSKLAKSIYGRFGGISLGITSSEIDENELARVFNVGVENFDMLAIVEEAKKFSGAEVEEVYKSVTAMVNVIPKFNKIFDRSIRVYLALKKMISNYSLDFCSVKCVFDLSRNYVGACLAQNILLNEGFISSCNGDTKGAVTMYMINLLSGGSIAYRPDIMKIDYANNTISLRSDGIGNFGMCESKNNMCLDYQSRFESPSGGICLNRAVFKQGLVNLAMLSKVNNRFCFHISEGETYLPGEDDFLIKDQWDQVPPKLPWAYARIKGNMDNFVLNSFSGFTILVLDDIRRELIYLAKLLNIDVSLDY